MVTPEHTDRIQQSVTGTLLCSTLEASVPFRILDLRRRGGPTETDWDWARAFADRLGSEGDNLLYRSSKKGQTAALLAGLVDALAIMAFAPGGVTIFGLHFEATVPEVAA